MSAQAVVLRTVRPGNVDELRAALGSTFLQIKQAIANDSAVVVVVPSEDLLGHGLPEGAAYVNAIVGMTRAIAFEGARAGWRINTVALPSTHELSDAEVAEAVSVSGLTGQVLTVGTTLVGKVIP